MSQTVSHFVKQQNPLRFDLLLPVQENFVNNTYMVLCCEEAYERHTYEFRPFPEKSFPQPGCVGVRLLITLDYKD